MLFLFVNWNINCLIKFMRYLIFLICSLFTLLSFSQDVFPFTTNLGFFKSFENGYEKQLDFLAPTEVKFSEKLIVYKDHKRDLFVYNKEHGKVFLANTATKYEIGFNHVAWSVGPILSMWVDGKRKHLTNFGRDFIVSDSLVVYVDRRDNALRAYYNDSIYDVFYGLNDISLPKKLGVNTFGFQGLGGVNYIFDKGKITEIGVALTPIDYESGTGFSAFNDPDHQTFALYEKGRIMDLETMRVPEYKATNEFVIYLDNNGNLMHYKDGSIKKLSNYSPDTYTANDNIVVWTEAGLFFLYDGNKIYEIGNFIPEDYKLTNEILAYRNVLGGVSAFYKGKETKITNIFQAPFEVNGNTVKIEVSAGNYIFWKDGKEWEF